MLTIRPPSRIRLTAWRMNTVRPTPGIAPYAASKGAVEQLTAVAGQGTRPPRHHRQHGLPRRDGHRPAARGQLSGGIPGRRRHDSAEPTRPTLRRGRRRRLPHRPGRQMDHRAEHTDDGRAVLRGLEDRAEPALTGVPASHRDDPHDPLTGADGVAGKGRDAVGEGPSGLAAPRRSGARNRTRTGTPARGSEV